MLTGQVRAPKVRACRLRLVYAGYIPGTAPNERKALITNSYLILLQNRRHSLWLMLGGRTAFGLWLLSLKTILFQKMIGGASRNQFPIGDDPPPFFAETPVICANGGVSIIAPRECLDMPISV